ncbi:hypothetical protein BM477_01505 [Boudabousia marimammalium]|uniref:Exonuclease domain-containing protein n=1 Tax=Boudabousia marimammalium TaxID=156892 RepID=A0A1Q5PTE2_9ACTO|nr:hypothetical protein BM477_01505 [Boudabousia marimammalium]
MASQLAALLDGHYRGFAVVDLETTSLSAEDGRILEVGVVLLSPSFTIEGTWNQLLNPGAGHDVGPTHIHHITEADVADAPTFAQIAGTLTELLQDRILIAHSSRFDSSFLQAAFTQTEFWPWPGLSQAPALCTLTEAKHFIQTPSRALTACCEFLGIPLKHHHRALHDADATALLAAAYLQIAGFNYVMPWSGEADTSSSLPASDLLSRLPESWAKTLRQVS